MKYQKYCNWILKNLNRGDKVKDTEGNIFVIDEIKFPAIVLRGLSCIKEISFSDLALYKEAKQ